LESKKEEITRLLGAIGKNKTAGAAAAENGLRPETHLHHRVVKEQHEKEEEEEEQLYENTGPGSRFASILQGRTHTCFTA
jgi:hypothetical protein